MSVRIFFSLSFTLVILPVRGQCGMQMKGAAFIIKEKVLKSIPCPFRIYKLCGPLLISQPRRNSPSPITPVGNCAIQTTGDMAWQPVAFTSRVNVLYQQQDNTGRYYIFASCSTALS